MRAALAAPVVALAATLAACGGGPEPINPCPRVSILRDAESLTRFVQGPGRDLIDVRFESAFGAINATCRVREDRVDMSLDIEVIANLGPAAQARVAEVHYFVAVIDRTGAILAKEAFAAAIEFPGSASRAGLRDEIVPRIPLAEGARAADYEVLIGFQLDAAELDYNRRKAVR